MLFNSNSSELQQIHEVIKLPKLSKLAELPTESQGFDLRPPPPQTREAAAEENQSKLIVFNDKFTESVALL